MKVGLRWRGGASFVASDGRGHEFVIDGPPEHGGVDAGPRPMETLLMGAGACAAFDIVHILSKARQKVSRCEAEVEAERADAVPAVFTKLRLHFRVGGEDLSAAQVARAVKLSAEKYCSASIMLERAGVAIEHSHEIVAGEGGD